MQEKTEKKKNINYGEFNADGKKTEYLFYLYNTVFINQGLLKNKLITVASMPAERRRVIRSYAVSNLTLLTKVTKQRSYLVFAGQ